MIDANGVPTIEAAKGTAAGREAMALALVPQTPQVSFATLVDEALAQLDAAAVIVIDPLNRKLYVTDDSTKGAALVAAATNSGTYNGCVLTPEDGQEGRSLTWDRTEAGTPTWSSDAGAVVSTETKPKKTVSAAVSAYLQSAYDGEENTPTTRKALIVVDQINGVIKVAEDSNGAKATAVANVTLNAGNSAEITLSEPPSEGTASKLIFEGGATS